VSPVSRRLTGIVLTTGELLEGGGLATPRERHYKTQDLEVYYFNNTARGVGNCDLEGPAIGAGPYGGAYHKLSGNSLEFAVPALDSYPASGVWRALVVYTDHALDAQGLGHWKSLELVNDGTGVFRAVPPLDMSTVANSKLTYMIQAIDNRGNVTWRLFVPTPDEFPESGVDPVLPLPIHVAPTAPPGPVKLLSPKNAAQLTLRAPTLDWSDSQEAITYKVQLRRGSTTGPLLLDTTATVSQLTTPTLGRWTRYYWRVAACNALSCTDYTTWWKFKVK